MTSEVSVMMPCFNAAESLPRAISSLLAQTHTNWKCIVVNDGSTDRTRDVLDALCTDERFNVIHLPFNVGRGVARQTALKAATGNYISFLDADDWYYPEKLERQVDVLDAHADVTAVSCKFTALSAEGSLLGFSWALAKPTTHLEKHHFRGLSRPPLNYVSSMLRLEVAREFSYDPRLKRAQDMDFMIKALQWRSFAIQPDAGYVYSGWAPRKDRSREAFHYEKLMLRSHFRAFPFQASARLSQLVVKDMISRILLGAGLENTLSASRLQAPTTQDQHEFDRAFSVVRKMEDTLVHT